MQRFSLRNVVRMTLVLSSQRFSLRKYVHRFISLAFSTFLHTLLARSHFTGLVFPRLSVWECIRTISLHLLALSVRWYVHTVLVLSSQRLSVRSCIISCLP